MKKIILSLFVVSVMVLQSCQEAKVDPAQVEAKVNELAAKQIEEATAKSTSDCEARMATELKNMADSLVHAKQMEQAAQ